MSEISNIKPPTKKPASPKKKPVFMTENVLNAKSACREVDKVRISRCAKNGTGERGSGSFTNSLSSNWADDARLPGGDAGPKVADDAHLPGGDAGLKMADDAQMPGGDSGVFNSKFLQTLLQLVGRHK